MFFNEVKNTLEQLCHSLEQISDAQYRQPVSCVFNATVGQHVRHVIELFQCLQQGYEPGLVNYELRKRDMTIETCRQTAIVLLNGLAPALHPVNKDMVLEAAYNHEDGGNLTVATNYFRELAYNLEHTIHHMALIRIALHDLCGLQVAESYGVAPATLQYRKLCVQ